MNKTFNNKKTNDSSIKLKDKIIDLSLPDINFDGWSKEVILSSFKKCKLKPEEFNVLFPLGIIDVVIHFIEMADRKMINDFHSNKSLPGRIPERIKSLIMSRFEYLLPYKEAVRYSIGTLTLPQYAHLAANSLYKTTDEIWRAAGDKSTDFSFYTKRGTLAGVYSSTLIYWIGNNDKTIDSIESFLDRRLDNIAKFGKLSKPFKNNFNSLFNFFQNIRYSNNNNHQV